jgi:hypothetical protein
MTMKTKTTIENDFENFLKKFVFELLPAFKRDIADEIEKVEKNARKNWLVRSKNSQGSINEFEVDVYISQGVITGAVTNYAPYAWMIKVGRNSKKTSVRPGKKLANELLVKPVKKLGNTLTKKLADEMLKIARKS